ncbi:MAG: hypothetical protein WDW36_002169 [Sanguina aurantia]
MLFDDGHPTETSKAQTALEKWVLSLYQHMDTTDPHDSIDGLKLTRAVHIPYVQAGLGQLSAGFACLDASRPWMCYWLVHSLALLDAPLPDDPCQEQIIHFLSCCQHAEGGFGGGPFQVPHLAPSYAAVSALVTLGSPAALAAVNRPKMLDYLTRMCVPREQGGGFTVHAGGEVDVRSCYTAMAIAHILGLDKAALAERSGMVDYIVRCQTYEGGMGGEPGNEAHGGYTYCAVAALALADSLHSVDLPRLLHWAVMRQGHVEGGFNGRTNKLVDGCYSLWVGGLFPLLQRCASHQLLRGPVRPGPGGAGDPPCSLDVAMEPATATDAAGSEEQLQQQQQQLQQQLQERTQVEGHQQGAGPSTVRSEAHTQQAPGDSAAVQMDVDPVGGAPAGPTQPCGADTEGSVHATTAGVPGLQRGEPRTRRPVRKVLPLPPLHVMDPVTEAELCAALVEDASGSVLAEANAASEAADQALEHTPAHRSSSLSAAARLLLDKAALAHTRSTAGTGRSRAPPAADSMSAAMDRAALPSSLLFNHAALQLWILRCCQGSKGGLRDKPGKNVDFYHSCYCLSGLASVQHASREPVGGHANMLQRSDPCCNVVDSRLRAALAYFKTQPL